MWRKRLIEHAAFQPIIVAVSPHQQTQSLILILALWKESTSRCPTFYFTENITKYQGSTTDEADNYSITPQYDSQILQMTGISGWVALEMRSQKSRTRQPFISRKRSKRKINKQIAIPQLDLMLKPWQGYRVTEEKNWTSYFYLFCRPWYCSKGSSSKCVKRYSYTKGCQGNSWRSWWSRTWRIPWCHWWRKFDTNANSNRSRKPSPPKEEKIQQAKGKRSMQEVW